MIWTNTVGLVVPLAAKSDWHSIWNKVDKAFPHLHTGMLAIGVTAAVILVFVAIFKLVKNIRDRAALKLVGLAVVVMFLVSDPGTVGGWFDQLMEGAGKAFKAIFHFFVS